MNTPTNPTPVATPAQILRDAATYLQVYGWTTDNYYDRSTAAAFPPACASGAIYYAACGVAYPATLDGLDSYYEAEDFFVRHLGLNPKQSDLPIADWNDRDGQTADTVITALRSAADAWESKHAGGAA
ncbi:MAG: hypothetical protein HOV77_32015 [Hamadaea sp.]|uniref:DUF6197 family protein n=1 Tax=Hamadaea sp. TaxID=2024425 RepID=UPI0017BD41A5|nr:hypothetical protein [Hamadaea sp.]NUT23814.1 hypothetical protein [Hamadaea sp.]